MAFDFELVGKIGSMALIRQEDRDIDYNIFSRIGSELRPGMIWVTSGAAEIGRLDYMKRTGKELSGLDTQQDKADYSAQGQTILMQTYRQFIRPEYGIRQLLVEHPHFNDEEKREHIRKLLIRSAKQNTIPIINYNDPVSDEEIRKMELSIRREAGEKVHECVDNDETAAVVADLVHAKILLLLTTTEGIYQDRNDPSTLVREVEGANHEELTRKIRRLQENCVGASRAGANGAYAKLAFSLSAAKKGTTVIIGHAKYHLTDLLQGKVPCTRIGLK
ncbi:MAG: uridylate kinase [Clostridiales bacterium]|nr:uridylate kinase [Clostridiales bacterium]